MPKKDYYEQILKQAEDLINNKEYKKALEIISSEISAPYIPGEYINRFESLYVSLTEKVNIEEIEKKYNSMTKNQLLIYAYDGRKLEINVFSFFLAKFKDQIDNLDFAIIEQIFLNKSISNDVKIFALEQIKLSEINHDFDFLNNITNMESKINSQSAFELNESPFYIYVNNKIEEALFKEPSLKPLAEYIVRLCYEYYFGSCPPYSKDELASNIVDYVTSFFNDNLKNQKQEFVNWINLLFSFKKLKN